MHVPLATETQLSPAGHSGADSPALKFLAVLVSSAIGNEGDSIK